MKILYIITGLGQGGAERVVCDLADSMFERDNEVKIIYLVGDILTRPTNDSIELTKLNLNRVLDLPKACLKLSQIIRNYKPDIVHSHMIHANILSRLIRTVIPMNKLISTAHSSNEGGLIRMIAYRLTDKLSDFTSNVSDVAVNTFEKNRAVPKGRMKTVYNGVDFKKFTYDKHAKQSVLEELNIDSSYKVILAVGRFSEAKNYPNLLKSIGLLKKKYNQNFKLVIAGDGELRSNIEALIDLLELKDDVLLLGRRNDINRLMSACDVFVLSSDYEGLPTVLIEAVACQKHVVSTDVSGAREIIDTYGEIVSIDDFDELALGISKALSLDSNNISGYKYAKSKFDLNIISEQWLSIYNEK